MAPALQEALASRSNISNKVILTRKMLKCEDVVKICLSNDADKTRGVAHLILDDNLKDLFLVKKIPSNLTLKQTLWKWKLTSYWAMVTLQLKLKTWWGYPDLDRLASGCSGCSLGSHKSIRTLKTPGKPRKVAQNGQLVYRQMVITKSG